MKKIILDFSDCKYISEIHRIIKNSLELPVWYGENLDALWDCLTGVIETPIEIIINPATSASLEIKDYIKDVIDVFKEAKRNTGK